MPDKTFICSICDEKMLAREIVRHHIFNHKKEKNIEYHEAET